MRCQPQWADVNSLQWGHGVNHIEQGYVLGRQGKHIAATRAGARIYQFSFDQFLQNTMQISTRRFGFSASSVADEGCPPCAAMNATARSAYSAVFETTISLIFLHIDV